ncbi:hypothetical protein DDZ14_04475 [Maritimibacter sp. 55A14]|uniref:DUF6478 family protein n=1 Tax=Maritimibacter sp. 55A14 TaxID=2174844 RepID=UPI000D60DD74|nr:DUF6478 family protein [Maritimibacter sp. 55A14]PWE33458.1 hypothetical protein DDZ14_04475 [Maritimibacter sp. 55A14]
MLDRLKLSLSGLVHRAALRRWDRAIRSAERLEPERLRRLRARARQLRHRTDKLTQIADSRLTLPLIGSNAIQKPAGSDWGYRPELWRGPITPPGAAGVETRTKFGAEATLFHDCAISEITMRQIRNTRPEDLAPFGFRLDVFRFDGSFLSLVLDMPPEAVEGLKRNYLVRLDTTVEFEKPLEMFVRLNIRHGPNTEQIVRELPLGAREVMVEFDLAYTNLNEKRIERMWLDLIFEGPEMNQIILRDVTLSRRPRAAL